MVSFRNFLESTNIFRKCSVIAIAGNPHSVPPCCFSIVYNSALCCQGLIQVSRLIWERMLKNPQKFCKIRYNSVLSYLSFLGWFFQGYILKFDKIPCHIKLTFVKTTSKKKSLTKFSFSVTFAKIGGRTATNFSAKWFSYGPFCYFPKLSATWQQSSRGWMQRRSMQRL